MKNLFGAGVKFGLALTLGLTTSAFAADACTDQMAKAAGSAHPVSGNKIGEISGTPWGFEQWSGGGTNSMTYYDNGTFEAEWSNNQDYLTRVGFRYGDNGPGVDHNTKSYAVDYRYTRTGSAQYGYIGVYGWTVNPQVEYYIVDDWYSKPNEQYIGEKFGEIEVDSAKYTIHAYLRQQEPSKTGTSTFLQIFSIRETPRQCGHIDISAHFKKWDELFTGQTKQLRGSKGGGSTQLKFGKVTEVMLLTEAGGKATGSVKYTYFDMTDKASSSSVEPKSSTSVAKSSSSVAKSSSSKGGSSTATVDACEAEEMGHPGSGTDVSGNKVGSISGTPWGFEQWYQGGDATMTYYGNGTFKANWSGVSDYLTRVGFQYGDNGPGVDHNTKQYGVDYKYTKTGDAQYGYIGVYGWTVNPQVEYYIVDDWFRKPNEQYIGEKFGEIEVDGAIYTIHAFLRQQEPSKTGTSTFLQIFSIRQTPRQCGHIDISAHFKKWDELFTGQTKSLRGSKGGGSTELKFGKVTEVMLMTEAGGNATGSVDYTYFNMTDTAPEPESSSSEEVSSSSQAVSSNSEKTALAVAGLSVKGLSGKFQVFDMQGRYLGAVELSAGADIKQVLFEKFHKSGVYMVKQGAYLGKVKVNL